MAKKTASTARKTVLYRRCVITPKSTQTLQQLVAAALVAQPKASDRYEPLNAQSTELRCIGKHVVSSNCLCGYLTTFERGAAQPVIGDDPTAVSLRLGALPPPPAQKGGVQQQYVPGVVYFAIYQNHLALVQSSAIRSNALENHLSWLLKERTNQLAATDSFALSDEAQKATKAKIRKSHVKSISLGQPLMAEEIVTLPAAAQGADKGHQKAPATNAAKKQRKFRPQGPMVDLIRSYFTDQSDFEKLGLDEVFDGNLEVWIEIRYPKRKRTRPEDAMKLMDTLGVALRDIEGDQVALQLADGSKVTGKELKISAPLDFPVLAHNLPDESKLWDEMSAWLLAQLAHGVVDP